VRGSEVDREVRPDAELWINGAKYFLELDRGTMSYAQVVRSRFPKYAGTGPLVLWVCSTPVRREGLRLQAASVAHRALFATLGEALVSPHGEIWIDPAGATAALPRSRGDRKPVVET
jgi:hypothetical protein